MDLSAFDVDGMPESIKKKLPAGCRLVLAGPLPARLEQLFDPFRQTELFHALRPGDERCKLFRAPAHPFSDRNREAPLGRKWLGLGKRVLEPTAEQIFAVTLRYLQTVGQLEGEIGDHRIEERGASFESERHQAAVDLQEEIVGQPIGAV